MDEKEFEDGIAATNLLPGPASTQLAIFCAWRLRGAVGAVLGGLCFIIPGLALILALSVVFLANHPQHWVLGAAAGAGAAVPAVALNAASETRSGEPKTHRYQASSSTSVGLSMPSWEVLLRPQSVPTWCWCSSPVG